MAGPASARWRSAASWHPPWFRLLCSPQFAWLMPLALNGEPFPTDYSQGYLGLVMILPLARMGALIAGVVAAAVFRRARRPAQ